MFIYHGWIEIEHQNYLQAYFKGDIKYYEYRKRLLDITSDLERIAEDQFHIKGIDLKIMDGTNGIITVHLSGFQNHFHYGVEDLLGWIKEHAPMSYGLVFYRNGESDEFENDFRVLRLAKNHIEVLQDFYLSPIDKVIESKREG